MIAIAAAQGTVFEIRRIVPYRQQPRELQQTKRGVVVEFSRNSRRRLMVKMARMAIETTRTTFLTLTFSSVPTLAFARAAFKRFTMRLRRKYTTMSAVWRIERQARGAIHFHLICFNMPYWKQELIQKTWEKCTHEQRSIVHVKLIKNKRMLMNYVSKYVAKKSDAALPSLDKSTYQHAQGETGRHWGVINAERLPFAPLDRRWIEISNDAKRYAWFAVSSLSNKHAGNYEDYCLIFTKEAQKLLDYLIEISEYDGEKVIDSYIKECAFKSSMTSGRYGHVF